MQERMKNPLLVLPQALQALKAVDTAAQDGLSLVIREMVRLRASQINGCGACVDIHSRELREAGESAERIAAVAAWRETRYFTPAERAALALAESATRLADRSDAVPDDIWEAASQHYDEAALAALIVQIGLINVFNRVNVSIRQPIGAAA